MPADLRKVSDAVGGLLDYLFRVVNLWHQALARDRVAPSPQVQQTAAIELARLRECVEEELAAVGRAGARSGEVLDRLEDLIELAQEVHTYLASLHLADSPHALLAAVNRLSDFALQISKFQGGPQSGIVFKIETARRRSARAVARGRRSPGRPIKEARAAAGRIATELRSRGMAWKEIVQDVNQQLNQEYACATLKRYASEHKRRVRENGG